MQSEKLWVKTQRVFSSSRIRRILERIQELEILGVSDLENVFAISGLKPCAKAFSQCQYDFNIYPNKEVIAYWELTI